MKSISAKELKNQTGTVLRRVEQGEKVLITKRGKPCAIVLPAEEKHLKPSGLRVYGEAWQDIERTLNAGKPRFKTWQEAMRWTRWRG